VGAVEFSDRALSRVSRPELGGRLYSWSGVHELLIPHWAKDREIADKTINARAEIVDSAQSYR
jgi:hypothetical protein